MKVDCLIIGAGFVGAECAEKLASAGKYYNMDQVAKKALKAADKLLYD